MTIKFALIYPEVEDLARVNSGRKEIPPMGIMYLASHLEKNNIYTKIYKISRENYSLDLRKFDIIGFSLSSSVTYNLLKRSNLSSLFQKNSLKVVGGFQASIYPKEVLMDFKPDIVCIGDGEESIIEIVNEYKSNKNYLSINGICFSNNGDVHFTKSRNSFDMKKQLIPSRHLMSSSDIIMYDRLSNTDLKMTHVMISKGCNAACKFCAVQNKKVQYQTLLNINKEISMLKKDYNIEGFAIIDDNVFYNEQKAINICEEIKKHKLFWSAPSRIDSITKETIKSAKNSGCIEIKFGLESGSQDILFKMGKNIKVKEIREKIKLTSESGIKTKITVIHGFPGENLKTTNETIKLLNDLKKYINRVALIRFVPLPGSLIFRQYELYNIINIPNEFSDIDWDIFHLYQNNRHWWGSKKDYDILNKSYDKIVNFIKNEFEFI